MKERERPQEVRTVLIVCVTEHSAHYLERPKMIGSDSGSLVVK